MPHDVLNLLCVEGEATRAQADAFFQSIAPLRYGDSFTPSPSRRVESPLIDFRRIVPLPPPPRYHFLRGWLRSWLSPYDLHAVQTAAWGTKWPAYALWFEEERPPAAAAAGGGAGAGGSPDVSPESEAEADDGDDEVRERCEPCSARDPSSSLSPSPGPGPSPSPSSRLSPNPKPVPKPPRPNPAAWLMRPGVNYLTRGYVRYKGPDEARAKQIGLKAQGPGVCACMRMRTGRQADGLQARTFY